MAETTGGPVVRPYGDSTDDGMVQLSFTLPLPADHRAEPAARQLAAQMGVEAAMVVHTRQVGDEYTFFVVYGRVRHAVDVGALDLPAREFPLLRPPEVDAAVRRTLRRRLSVVGACVGTDAHTVGIDAICNLKGVAGEKGLEYYRELAVTNLGAQVPVAALVEAAQQARADAVLVSQVVTQRDAHLHNVRAVAAAFAHAHPAGDRPLLVAGGPRFDTSTAAALGVDRVFARGTTPGEVASYLVHALVTDSQARVTGDRV